MTAIDTILIVLSTDALVKANLKYCFHKEKVPYNGTSLAKPDTLSDFVELDKLDLSLANEYSGIGISIQASKISAIDVDHCFKSPFNFDSIDARGRDIYDMFKDLTYIEFSYSGTGMRVLFKSNEIINYKNYYMTKNSKTSCEYYYPEGSNRYVTITGRSVTENDIGFITELVLVAFLNKYMLRPKKLVEETKHELLPEIDTKELLMHFIRSDKSFQDIWFSEPSGSGGNESECDYFLLSFIYKNITKNKDKVKEIFESSFFFKHKDKRHIRKWEYNDNRYFNYIWGKIDE